MLTAGQAGAQHAAPLQRLVATKGLLRLSAVTNKEAVQAKVRLQQRRVWASLRGEMRHLIGRWTALGGLDSRAAVFGEIQSDVYLRFYNQALVCGLKLLE